MRGEHIRKRLVPILWVAAGLAGGCNKNDVRPEQRERPGEEAPRAVEPAPVKPAEAAPPAPPPVEPPAPPEPVEPEDPFHIVFEVQKPETFQRRWAQVTGVFNEGQAASVDAKWARANLIEVATQNVSGLRFDLAELPVDARRSCVFRLDGQAIEITQRHGRQLEFERGQAGVWTFIKP